MCDNTKRFFRNSLLSVLGFLLAGAVMVLSFRFEGGEQHKRMVSGIVVVAVAAGLIFYGYKVLKPLKSAWQTVLSVDVLPVSALLILTVFLTFVFEADFPGEILLVASAPFFNLFPAKFVLDDITATLIVFLTPLLLFIYMHIGMAVRKAYENSGGVEMKKIRSAFLKNSLLSLLGFLAADALAAIVLFSSVFNDLLALQLAAGTVLLLCGAGLSFLGYTFVRPLQKVWQTVLSVTVVPLLILLAASGLLSLLFQSQYPLLLLAIPGNLIFALIPEETGFWQNDITPLICLCLMPLILFLCTAVGAVMRSRLEKGEM